MEEQVQRYCGRDTLDCSEHSNHHVPTSTAEKVGAEQLGPRMEIENYRPKSSRSYGSH